MKTYIFKASLQQEEDKRWSSWIDDLPGCAAWGYTREEALKAVQDAAEAYIEDMIEAGERRFQKRG
ncbi:MAG: type II toxin-antitoxin system HicB family antitoxin [Dehalococcoidia bacterium]|nr:type II toxin-antitoxin system HicB family antitoxin [Dehalococcoidia bacterium]